VEFGTALATYGKVLQDWAPLLNISREKAVELTELNDRLEKEIEDAHARGELTKHGDDGQGSAVNQ